MTRFAFRVNGNKDIGMGHLMRCLSLAECLGEACVFAVNDSDIVVKKVKECGYRHHILSSVTDDDFAVMVEALQNYPEPFERVQPSEEVELKELENLIRCEKIEVLVTDLLTPSRNYLQALKKRGVLLVSLDEVGGICFPSDLLFNCNSVSVSRGYKTEEGTKVFMGQQYVLLHRGFYKTEKRSVRKKAGKILITCGGTDMKGLSLKVLQALQPFSKEMEIVLVRGLDFKFQRELSQLLKEIRTVRVLNNVKNMRELMQSADIAVASGGTTMYELAVLGVPSVILGQYAHQNEFATALAEQNAVINLGLGEEIRSESIQNAVTGMLSFEKRKTMSESGRAAIDGLGVERVAKIILEAAA